ncbi:MAG: BON domain-containing protein [Planctomycetes bacterium]|nr:BON domain-containing protein [Planctomycetota bacterium]
MTLRSRSLLAAAVGLWMAYPVLGQEPPRLETDPGQVVKPQSEPSLNQQVANTIAERLRLSGQLQHYSIQVVFQEGTAELTGSVADQPQREEVLRLVQGVPGVERVRDRLLLAQGEPLTRTQATGPELQPLPATEKGTPLPTKEPPAPELQPPPALEKEAPLPTREPPAAVPEGTAATPPEPAPIYQAPLAPGYDLNPPKMPSNAWPTYAPYNNYSRVAYPTAYPYNAWPFIGPIYPFPKVPLGWRSINLTWEDGHWWYGNTSCSHEWWLLRFW